MTAGPDYSPKTIFSLEERGRETPPFGLIAPARYVQGPGLLDELGHFLALVPSRRPAVLISAGGLRRHREQLLAGLGAMDSEPAFENLRRPVLPQRDRTRRGQPAGARGIL